MSPTFSVTLVNSIDDDLREMAAAAEAEGFGFMQRMVARWEDGSNRFDAPGEVYLAVRRGATLVAAGGLNRDPYAAAADIGRVRHLYVVPGARRYGVGSILIREIVMAARDRFGWLRLRTNTERGSAFYEAMGFERCDEGDATHRLKL